MLEYIDYYTRTRSLVARVVVDYVNANNLSIEYHYAPPRLWLQDDDTLIITGYGTHKEVTIALPIDPMIAFTGTVADVQLPTSPLDTDPLEDQGYRGSEIWSDREETTCDKIILYNDGRVVYLPRYIEYLERYAQYAYQTLLIERNFVEVIQSSRYIVGITSSGIIEYASKSTMFWRQLNDPLVPWN